MGVLLALIIWHKTCKSKPLSYKLVIYLDTSKNVKFGYYNGKNWWYLRVSEKLWQVNRYKTLEWMYLCKIHAFTKSLLALQEKLSVPWFKRFLRKRKHKIEWKFY